MQRKAQRRAARRSLEQRGDDLCHSSHSFPSDNSQGGKVREDYLARAGRDGSSRMHVRVGGGHERGELGNDGVGSGAG